MSLSIIIPTWNCAELTCACLASLRTHTAADFRIIWIDNGSTQEQYERVADALTEFDHEAERHPQPLGFAKAVNRGLRNIRTRYCVILNNDLTVGPSWDRPLREAVDDRAGLAGPICVNSTGWQNSALHPWLGIPAELAGNDEACMAWLSQHWCDRVVDIPEEVNLPGFRNMLAFFCVLMPATVQRHLGLLDENFGWGFFEDDDYCHRARLAGYGLSLCPASTVVHRVGETQKQIADDVAERLAENRAYLKQKWAQTQGVCGADRCA